VNYLCLDNSPIILQYDINAVLDVTHNARDCVGLAQRVEDATGWWAERTGRVNPRAALAPSSRCAVAPRAANAAGVSPHLHRADAECVAQ
jgi:hypothetical protein